MSVLPARLLAGPFPQTADANWLLQAVAGRRFAAVATVQAKPAFQFRDPLLQLRDQGLLRGVLFPQCRNDGPLATPDRPHPRPLYRTNQFPPPRTWKA